MNLPLLKPLGTPKPWLAIALVLAPLAAVAADAAQAGTAAAPVVSDQQAAFNQSLDILLYAIYMASFAILALLFVLVLLLDYFFRTKHNTSILPKFNLGWKFAVGSLSALWGTRPVRKGAPMDVSLGHSNDGIQELDNAAPPLFNYILYGTILFAVVYLTYHHVGGWGKTQMEEYYESERLAQAELAEFRRAHADLVDENTITLNTDAAVLATGQRVYAENCAACHGAAAEGKTGPNLTDVYWVHGGTINQVFRIVNEGVPAKGMIPWKGQLSPSQIGAVSNYVLSLQGTNPANAKAPEGQAAASAPADTLAPPQDTLPAPAGNRATQAQNVPAANHLGTLSAQ